MDTFAPIDEDMADTAAARSVSSALPRRAEIRPARKPASGFEMLLVATLLVAALYVAREVFVPFALAVLLSFVLAPLVLLLRRWRFGRVPSVIVAVLLAFLVIFGVGAVIAGQLATLARNLPQYQTNITEKIHSLRGITGGSGIVERASSMLKDLSAEISRAGDDAGAAAGNRQPGNQVGATPGAISARPRNADPVPVEIRQPDPKPLQVIQNIVGPLLGPLANAGIVVVFVVFILLQREDLRDRLIRLAGAEDLQRTTQAINDAAARVSRYLLMQTIVNVTYGVPIGLGLWLIGVPNPVLWGILATLLRFVPYIGPFIAAMFPLALSIAVDPGWTMLAWTGALFVTVELISNNVVEPQLYGESTGLSTVAIIVAASFWTWLWGPVGLLLSTPLTSCLVALGRHVPQFQFFDVALGNEPVLAPEESFYQRMLAGDPDEATGLAEAFLKDKPLSAYYDEVAIPGLALAQFDLQRSLLDDASRTRIRDAVEGVIDNLSDQEDGTALSGEAPATGSGTQTASDDGATMPASAPVFAPAQLAPSWRNATAVLCISTRGDLDAAAAAMLAQLVEKHGIGARVIPCDMISTAKLRTLDVAGTRVACLSYLDPNAHGHARYLVRRLRRVLPADAKILAGFWTATTGSARSVSYRERGEPDLVAHSLGEAVHQICAIAGQTAAETAASAPSTPPQAHAHQDRATAGSSAEERLPTA